MKQYKVFKHPSGSSEAVKQGWSWPSFFFTFIWALVKKMWGLGFGVLVGVIVFGFIVDIADGGKGGDSWIRFFAFIVIFIVHITFGNYGNLWHEKNIVSRGFEQVAAVPAANSDGAILAHAQGIEWETLNDEVESLSMQGRNDRAVVEAKKALQVAEQAVGPNHPAVAQSLNNLAELYRTQGQHAQAEPLYKRSLAIREKALGPDHPDVAQSLNNLALLYDTQGQHAQAEPLYKRSLAIVEKALGPDHPYVATSLENMAMLYRKTGRQKEAGALEKRAETIRAIKR